MLERHDATLCATRLDRNLVMVKVEGEHGGTRVWGKTGKKNGRLG